MEVRERINFTEVIRELDYQGLLKEGTIIITDFDNTIIRYSEMAENLLQLQPEKIPDEVLTQVHKVVESGAKLAIATNRPKEGFSIAEKLAEVLGKYPVFPKSLEKMGVEVFGGGPLFMLDHFKGSDNAFYTLKSWLLADAKSGGAGLVNSDMMTIVSIGDRPRDISFFDKLQDIIDNDYPDVKFIEYKLPGFEVEDNKSIHKSWWSSFKRFLLRFVP